VDNQLNLAKICPVARFWIIAALLTGCGHPASVEECEEIVARIARLELEERKVAASAVDREIQAAQTAMRERTKRDCVGKRITNSAMQCVREAHSSKEIIEDCFR